MVEIGNRPDCVHCRFMLRQSNGEYRCRQHNMTLHSPISLYCKQIALPDEQDEAHQVWIREHIDPQRLEGNTLYTWVETHLKNGKKNVSQFNGEKLASISAYMTWAAGTFWQVLRDVRQAVRDNYRQHGFEVDE